MDIVMMMMMMSRFVEHVINGPQMRCRSAEQVCLQMSSECQWGVLPAGKLFQMNGPATAKLVIPIVCNLQIIRREIGEIMRYSCDQKKQNFCSLSNCPYCVDRAQSLPWPAPNICLTTFQISPKSVHFRRSYSRLREGRQNAP